MSGCLLGPGPGGFFLYTAYYGCVLQNDLQKGPFQLKIKVSPLKHALFANLKCKDFLNSAKSYVLKHCLPTFSQICLTKGSNFRR